MRESGERISGEELAGVTGESMPRVIEAVRHANRSWTLRLLIKGDARLRDGRVLRVSDREVSVRVTQQINRKPRRARRDAK